MPKSSNLWYLAHPVRADEQYTVQQNLDHTLVVMQILWNAGFNVIAPWHTICLFEKDESSIERCLALDQDVVKRTDGIILTGHKLSRGMMREIEVVTSFNSIFNLVRTPDKFLSSRALGLLEEKYEPR